MTDELETGFDYGEEVEDEVSLFVNPEVGLHESRIRSIIHLGHNYKTYKKKKETTAHPYVVFIFELKGWEGDDEEKEENSDILDDGTTISISRCMPMKKGEKALMTKLLKAVDRKGEFKKMGDLLTQPLMLDVKAGKEKGEDGKPTYVNCGDALRMLPKIAKHVPPLLDEGVGHVLFKDLTKEAILELHPSLEVQKYLMTAVDKNGNDIYKGSPAEAAIAEIRKEDPEFATGFNAEKPAEEAPSQPADPNPEKLDEDEEF